MRRLFRHVRQPALLLVADGHLEPEGTSVPPRWRAFARSRRGDLGARTRSPADSEPAFRARRDKGYLSLIAPGLRVAMRALERWTQPNGTGASRFRARSLDRSSVSPTCGRGYGSLPSVLGFHLDRQTVGGRCAKAHVRPNEKGAPSPWSVGPFTRASANTGAGARQRGEPPQGALPADAPGAPEAARAGARSEEDAESSPRRVG